MFIRGISVGRKEVKPDSMEDIYSCLVSRSVSNGTAAISFILCFMNLFPPLRTVVLVLN